MNKSLSTTLVVFAKAPQLGKVKTRMQPTLAPEQSVLLHRALVKQTLIVATNSDIQNVELWVGGEHAWWQELSNNYSVSIHLQQGQDLGERMYHASCDVLKRSDQVIIIGTDCPYMSPDYLNETHKLLFEKRIIIGPASDGGYVMIGLSQDTNVEYFNNIHWGESSVLAQTRNQFKANERQWFEMKMLDDIDRPADLDVLRLKMPQLLCGLDLE